MRNFFLGPFLCVLIYFRPKYDCTINFNFVHVPVHVHVLHVEYILYMLLVPVDFITRTLATVLHVVRD